ncbi:hypothetical protein [Mesorhizobium sp. LjRoot246]|uniref:hypothetical protein n=1 Tax=Mesorhizobium sp. LjRoot246 TaxID=3342294 RepID=UPI003ECE2A38
MLGLAVALGCLAVARAAEQDLDKGKDGDIMFVTPSGNIGCHYIPKGGTSTYQPMTGGPELQCDRVEPAYVAVFLDHKGKAVKTENPGEQGCCSLEQKLEYGNRWSEAPFTCLSAKIGLTCTSSDGHGFFISKSKITVH